MNLKKIYKNKNNIYLIVIFLFIMHQSNSFRNLFIIKKFDITERLIKSSGYCENAGYGFINDVYKENLIKKNIEILNDNPNFTFNNSVWFKYYTNKGIDKNKIILLNNKNSIHYINNNTVKLIFKKKLYGIYKISKKFDNCFYLEKND
tara:strand:- start:524 stop:967 length:444 start_codon:yes stop_codon:yes gene_type:complete